MFKIEYSSSSVTLPDPEFDDSIDFNIRVNVKIAMSGKLKTHVRKPAIKDRTYQFRGVRDSNVELLKKLIRDYKDKNLTITSYDGEVFTGKIKNEPTYELSNFDCKEWDFSLEIA